ncbi:ribonucleoprotein PTB-binding 2 [Tupaia chinensis]|uniref:ribonucleoprotein PTB-binding 2 n=1 Tax=Tupaia chinensis TaxID=246437 RepID=UPI0003C91DA5|nr:ribonucleoprotein PTB-binding 2 [Tupaia chinensis]
MPLQQSPSRYLYNLSSTIYIATLALALRSAWAIKLSRLLKATMHYANEAQEMGSCISLKVTMFVQNRLVSAATKNISQIQPCLWLHLYKVTLSGLQKQVDLHWNSGAPVCYVTLNKAHDLLCLLSLIEKSQLFHLNSNFATRAPLELSRRVTVPAGGARGGALLPARVWEAGVRVGSPPSRLDRQFRTEPGILVKNLPQDSNCQEVHDLLKDYELKYCYVDRNKRTAFVTLLNGEQAQNAIQMFHQYSFRGKELIVQLQPTDALLCITNLPISFTLEEFEELVRAYGNIERCFLVYSEVTGHSKGYGFVEYMKKDFAAKARLELLGKQLGASALFAQWMDVNLLASELIHSKCLCIDKLPSDYRDSEELLQFFSSVHKPVFCQLAQDEGSYVGGFAVVEYNTAEQAEEAQHAADGMTIRGSKIRVSFCAPGAPGRSTLAALIAAQRVMHSNQKGLLPEPNPVQIMKSLNNPAMLQVLLQPQLCGRAVKPVLGTPHNLPHLMNPSISPALLHLNKAHQSSVMGGTSNLFLQNLSHVPLAQQQLRKFEKIHTNNKPGLLGEPPAVVLQSALGRGSALPLKAELGPRGEAHKRGLLTGHHKQSQSQPKGTEINPGAASKNQTSLLGEPPKEIRLSKNPYLNLASVLPGVCLSSPVSKTTLRKTGITGNILDAISQGKEPQHALEKCIAYSPSFGDYAQVSSLRNEKRGASYLISAPEGGSVELADQHSQGTGAYYMESYLKKKRVY